jgi:TPR repeat protein
MAAMRLPSLLAALVWLVVSAGASSIAASAQADFMEGLAAYDAGDYRTAFEEWRALAEAGDAEAQTAIAGLYLDGLGTAVDPAAALRWYRRAAEQGEPVAQQNLGDLYGQGRGAARDLVSAYVWLSLAAEQGRRWSAQRRDELSPQLSPEQNAEAEARLEAWAKAR